MSSANQHPCGLRISRPPAMARELKTPHGVTRVLGVLVTFAMLIGVAGHGAAATQPPQAPTFKAGVDLVTVSVLVKDGDGKPVAGLSRQDFELTDAGRVRPIS